MNNEFDTNELRSKFLALSISFSDYFSILEIDLVANNNV